MAPPPPAPADLLQVPPDQLAGIDPPPPIAVPRLPEAPVRLHVLGDAPNDRLRWIGFAVLLMSSWTLAATRFGPEGMVPVEVRTRVSRLLQAVRPK